MRNICCLIVQANPHRSNNIFTVLRDNKNRMWMATFGGGLQLAERNSGKLTFRQFLFDNDHLNMMRSMIQDRDGLIWIGTNDGWLFSIRTNYYGIEVNILFCVYILTIGNY